MIFQIDGKIYDTNNVVAQIGFESPEEITMMIRALEEMYHAKNNVFSICPKEMSQSASYNAKKLKEYIKATNP